MILTESQLKELGRSSRANFLMKTLKSSSRQHFSSRQQKTIFLSHKHDEDKFVNSARWFFKDYTSINLYIDWLDDNMPEITNAETASKLKEAIQKSDKFIFLATEGAIHSQWCNWELGLGDTYKYPEHIALLPFKKDNKNYSGSEYLQIYPYIEYLNDRNHLEEFYVRIRKNNRVTTVCTLEGWLFSSEKDWLLL